ncbi:hypothetical protein N476_22610 [Pseudoalteromonas luteoviolacea H33]|uniref:Uncharacterized protein n=1 Tax=Pseudoalteromonas luteoviolacea H33 TaxID=1365251 RepID=A0A167CTD1_9GAMM|nr:hypothetical protein N476_22610 [Pseudoalteromonas luteoviolacea H33]KZN73822.1 hypothetical protein N477_22970 [Pseudoalteromonas luteoviolacea H33-S]
MFVAYHKDNENAGKLHEIRKMLGKEEPEAPSILTP